MFSSLAPPLRFSKSLMYRRGPVQTLALHYSFDLVVFRVVGRPSWSGYLDDAGV